MLFRSGIGGRVLLFTFILGCLDVDVGDGLLLQDEGMVSWSSLPFDVGLAILFFMFYDSCSLLSKSESAGAVTPTDIFYWCQ